MAHIPNSVPMTLKASEIARRRARVVKLVEQLPEATAISHGAHLSLEVRRKRFAWYLEDHHGDGRLALHCKATAGAMELLAKKVPDSLHIPKYLGQHGWVGLWLDLPQSDWPEVEALLAEAYRMTAPKSLVAQLTGLPRPGSSRNQTSSAVTRTR